MTAAVLVLCALGGGSSRADTASLLYLRPLAGFLLAGLVLLQPTMVGNPMRAPLVLLGLLAATIAIQLIPLPPGIEMRLPGHGLLAGAATLGEGTAWRPISLAPLMTLNSLLALLPMAGVLVGCAGLDHRGLERLVVVVIAITFASAIMGLVQIGSGMSGPAYIYAVSSEGLPVGLLANRNHQAALLAIALPMLGIWTRFDARSRQWNQARMLIAGALAILFLAMILVTGSRAGLVLGAIGLLAGIALGPKPKMLRRRRSAMLGAIGAVAVAVVLIGIVLSSGRALSIQRLLTAGGTASEQRIDALPTLLHMTRTFLPFGTGFGSFDPVFRMFEPDAALHSHYFNHAHNDVIELVLTGGIPALLVVVAALAWLARASLRIAAAGWTLDRDGRLGWVGIVSCLMLLAGSVADYPLRTPLLSAILAFAVACVAHAVGVGGASQRSVRDDMLVGQGRHR